MFKYVLNDVRDVKEAVRDQHTALVQNMTW